MKTRIYKIVLTLIMALPFSQAFGQKTIAYYDAKTLADLYKSRQAQAPPAKIPLTDATVVALLTPYFPTGADIAGGVAANPFLKNYFSGGGGASLTDDEKAMGTFFSKVAANVGGLDVTNAATGISDFLIERAKQELTVAFFDRFKKFATKNPEFAVLFPKTTDNLSNLLTYSYPQMLPALRDGFLEDLRKISYNLSDILALPRYQQLLKNFPEVKIAVRSLRLVNELETGVSNAADIINEFAAFPEWDLLAADATKNNAIRNAGCALKVGALFSQSIRSNVQDDSGIIWVDGKALKEVITDPLLFNIYMGLIWQQAQNITYIDAAGSTKKFSDILADPATIANIFVFQNKLQQFFDLSGKVNSTYSDIQTKKAGNPGPSNDDYYNYINVSIDVVDYSFSIVKIFDKLVVADPYLAIARKSNSLYKDIYSKQYTQAVTDGLDILTQVHDLVKISATIDADKDNLARILAFVDTIKPYALFMANMVEAKSPADVKAALETAVLPVGSYSIKQQSLCNISLNGYIGYALDYHPSLFANGIYAPIGFSFSRGSLWSSGGSLTLFGSFIDVGGLAAYRLANGSTDNLTQTITLESILSPSAQLFLEFPHLPIAIGAGWRLTPKLSYTNNTTLTVVQPASVINVSVLVDIPFFTLHNKANKQK